MQTDGRSGLNLVGPLFCSWKGSSACDARTAESLDLGVAPLYSTGKTPSARRDHPRRCSPTTLQRRDLHDSMGGARTTVAHARARMSTICPVNSIGAERAPHTCFRSPLGQEQRVVAGHPLFLPARRARRVDGRDLVLRALPRRHDSHDTPCMGVPDPDIASIKAISLSFTRTSRVSRAGSFFPCTPVRARHQQVRRGSSVLHPTTDCVFAPTFTPAYLGRDGQRRTPSSPLFLDLSEPKQRATVAFPFYCASATAERVRWSPVLPRKQELGSDGK